MSAQVEKLKNNPRTIWAWVMYDWANSAYPLVITTAIFPTFYVAVTTTKLADGSTSDLVRFFGYTLTNSELYAFVTSAAFLIVSVLSPVLSGVADFWGNKKFFLKFFCYMGALACGSLYFFSPEYLELSMVSVMLASIGFWGSLVFYNAFLPEIADYQQHDKISARGFSLGYLGSSLLLIALLVGIMVFEMPARYSFIAVMIWWIGFAQITYYHLPRFPYHRQREKRMMLKGIEELGKVWREIKNRPVIKRYLAAYFVYSMGVQTIMLMAVIFADKEIDWGNDGGKTGLIISVLIIQFIAIVGAGVFSRLSKRLGNIKVLKGAVLIWILVCVWAYYITTPLDFYFTAAAVGFVMGGIQALSRSTFSKLIPDNTVDHASYFSFYDVLEKWGIVLGTFSYGMAEALTGSLRNSIFALTAFFIIGYILLLFVPRHERLAGTGHN
jgi:UMF1 family MFS transporter